eukprot:TRINITY_DN23323_c0_g1_i1.p1 TRINITY_DN23323_c0_g1~~TRINITY_DN23323_c0_g1_i1.p1  ORF type:complete len:591 (+),score=41.60 TRINITY_DN23323_c0_g1_i1:90-1862(+)
MRPACLNFHAVFVPLQLVIFVDCSPHAGDLEKFEMIGSGTSYSGSTGRFLAFSTALRQNASRGSGGFGVPEASRGIQEGTAGDTNEHEFVSAPLGVGGIISALVAAAIVVVVSFIFVIGFFFVTSFWFKESKGSRWQIVQQYIGFSRSKTVGIRTRRCKSSRTVPKLPKRGGSERHDSSRGPPNGGTVSGTSDAWVGKNTSSLSKSTDSCCTCSLSQACTATRASSAKHMDRHVSLTHLGKGEDTSTPIPICASSARSYSNNSCPPSAAQVLDDVDDLESFEPVPLEQATFHWQGRGRTAFREHSAAKRGNMSWRRLEPRCALIGFDHRSDDDLGTGHAHFRRANSSVRGGVSRMNASCDDGGGGTAVTAAGADGSESVSRRRPTPEPASPPATNPLPPGQPPPLLFVPRARFVASSRRSGRMSAARGAVGVADFNASSPQSAFPPGQQPSWPRDPTLPRRASFFSNGNGAAESPGTPTTPKFQGKRSRTLYRGKVPWLWGANGACERVSKGGRLFQKTGISADMEPCRRFHSVLEELARTQGHPLTERKRIFRALQKQLHPDKNVSQTEEATLAFQTLMERRQAYLASH